MGKNKNSTAKPPAESTATPLSASFAEDSDHEDAMQEPTPSPSTPGDARDDTHVPGTTTTHVINAAPIPKLTDVSDMSIATVHNSIMTAVAPHNMTTAALDRTAATLLTTAAGTHHRVLANLTLGALVAGGPFPTFVAARHVNVGNPDTLLADLDNHTAQLVIWLFVCWRVANPRSARSLTETNKLAAGALLPVQEALMQLVAHVANSIEAYKTNGQVNAFASRPFAEQLDLIAQWFAHAGPYVTHVLTQAEPRPTTIHEFGIALRPHAQAIAAIQFMAQHNATQNNKSTYNAQRQHGRRAQDPAPAATEPPQAQPQGQGQGAPARATTKATNERMCNRCGVIHPFGKHTNPTMHAYCRDCATRHADGQHTSAPAARPNTGNVARNDDSVPA